MRFQYSVLNSSQDELDSLPRVPITLFNGNARVRALGIVDSGATVSVLPYTMGLALDAVWNEDAQILELTGNLARVPSIPIALSAEIDGLGRVMLVFAWSRSNDVPLILGQYNFFQEFDIHFYRSQLAFEINPKSPSKANL